MWWATIVELSQAFFVGIRKEFLGVGNELKLGTARGRWVSVLYGF